MSNRFIFSLIAAICFTGIAALIFLIIMMLSGGGSHVLYYSNPKNYIAADGVITSLRQSEDGMIVLKIETDTSSLGAMLKIIPENAALACANGFMDEVKVGDKVSLISAPAYFGDGYLLPIVGFSKNDKEYLVFSTGVSNQVAYQKSGVSDIIWPIIIPGALAVYFWISLFLQRRAKKKQIAQASNCQE